MMEHKNTLLITVLALSSYSSFATANSLQTQMDNTFNSLSNVTSPGAYNTARRGVFSGGQVYVKFPTKRVNVVSAEAPRINAGCGGIDLYGGSFSFINASQLVDTFKAIGTNAIGYGAKLAITSACPTCEQVMTSLEKTAQALNALNIDSCKAAQGLVNASPLGSQTMTTDNAAKMMGVNTGLFEDVNQAWARANSESTSASNQIKTNNPNEYKEKFTGNLAWRVYKEHNISTVFGGDDKFLEMLMTMTGTVIVNNPTSDTDTDPKATPYTGGGIKLAELINGGSIKTLKCDTVDKDGCLNPTFTQTLTDAGLQARFIDAFTGSDGIINKLQTKAEWSPAAKNLVSSLTVSGSLCLGKITTGTTYRADAEILSNIVEKCAPLASQEIAYGMVRNYIDTAISTIETTFVEPQFENAKLSLLSTLRDSKDTYFKEYQTLTASFDFQDLAVYLDTIKFTDGQTKNARGL